MMPVVMANREGNRVDLNFQQIKEARSVIDKNHAPVAASTK
jgi:hypothetical protein